MTRAAELERPVTRRPTFRGVKLKTNDGVVFAGRDDLIDHIKKEISVDDGIRYTSSELRQSLSREIGIRL